MLPPNADLDLVAAGKPPHVVARARRWREEPWPLFEPKTFSAARLRKLRSYAAAVSQVDAAIGQLLEWLDQAGIADETIVIYSSDHGEYTTEQGIMEKAPGTSSDSVTRIPFIWRGPGIAADRQVTGSVESVDLAVTCCALAGLPALQTADGHDLSAILQGGQADPARIGVTEMPWSKSVRRGSLRMV